MVLLKEQYGKQVVVNLLGNRGGEEVLNRAFKVSAAPAHVFMWGEGPLFGDGCRGGLETRMQTSPPELQR